MLVVFYLVIALVLGGCFVGAMFFFKGAATKANDQQRYAEGKSPIRHQP